MTTTTTLLDRVSKHLGDASDYRVAQVLEVNKASVSRWRVGKSSLSDATAMKVAEILGEDPAHVLALVHAERSDSPAAQKVWKRVAAGYAAKAVPLLLAGAVLMHGTAAHAASALSTAAAQGTSSVYYV